MATIASVSVGDHISSINGTDLTGSRHFEVARMLKEIPVGSEFSITCVEPKKAFDAIAPRAAGGAPARELKPGEAKKTLRMKTNGVAVVEAEPESAVTACINKMDELLEQFIGIRDNELCTTMYHIAKASKEADAFASALDAQLTDFEFPDDFVLDVFELVHKKK